MEAVAALGATCITTVHSSFLYYVSQFASSHNDQWLPEKTNTHTQRRALEKCILMLAILAKH